MGFFHRSVYRQRSVKHDSSRTNCEASLASENNDGSMFVHKMSLASTVCSTTLSSMTTSFLSKDGDGENSTEDWEPEDWRLSSVRSQNDIDFDSAKATPLKRISLAEFRKLQCSMSYRSQNQSRLDCDLTPSIARARALSNHKTDTNDRRQSYKSDEEGLLLNGTVKSELEEHVMDNNDSLWKKSNSNANVIAFQARRALQQMILSNEEDSDAESDTEEAEADAKIKISKEDYSRFQARLTQLEEICAEQSQKQSDMEKYIAEEVERRTRLVIQSNLEKVTSYKKALQAEFESRINKRAEKTDVKNRFPLRCTSAHRQTHIESSHSSSWDKMLHYSRMKRRSLEEPKVMQQEVKEIQQSERRAGSESQMKTEQSTEHLLQVIDILHEHLRARDEQMHEAEDLIRDAIFARTEAEIAAKEAIELSLELDERLGSVTQEICILRNNEVAV